MPQGPKNIFVIDDSTDGLNPLVAEVVFPHSTVQGFRDSTNALKALQSIKKGPYPDLLILDASYGDTLGERHYGWGVDNALSVFSWLQEHAPDHAPPKVIFQSADGNVAERSARYLTRELRGSGIDAVIIGVDKDELNLVYDILRPTGTPRLRASNTFALSDFLNKTYGYDLPATRAEFDSVLLSKRSIDPEEVVRLVNDERLPRDEGLDKLGDKIRDQVNTAYRPTVQCTGKDFDINMLRSFYFNRGTGNPAVGPAAFSAEDVIRQSGNGEKPVLIVRSVDADIVQLFKHVAAIVVLGNHGSGHLEQIAEAHQIPALLGYNGAGTFRSGGVDKKVKLHTASVNAPDAKPYLSIHARINLLNFDIEPDEDDLESDDIQFLAKRGIVLTEIPQPNNASRAADFEDADFYKARMIVRPGDYVTVEPHRTLLYATRLPFATANCSLQNYWLDCVRDMLRDWHDENGVKPLKFKKNIDVLDQMSRDSTDDGIGLVRTEHLVISSPEALPAFRGMVLKDGENHRSRFEELSQKDFVQVLEPLCRSDETRYPVRMRLIDAPPSEFFSDKDRDRFAALYGDRNLRGVQLAQCIPELYETQIRAIFKAHLTLQQRAKEDSFYDPPTGLLEIMVPTTRTAEEIIFARDMIARVSREMGFSRDSYRFGSMLETRDAVRNIREIAPLCDFMSIGSNDLTSEILGCDRNDWIKRRKLTIDSGTNSDPFITLHGRVLSVISEAVQEARAANPKLQIDLCGAHAADIASLTALRQVNLDGVSMPPSPQNHEGLPLFYHYNTFQLHRTRPVEADRDLSRRIFSGGAAPTA